MFSYMKTPIRFQIWSMLSSLVPMCHIQMWTTHATVHFHYFEGNCCLLCNSVNTPPDEGILLRCFWCTLMSDWNKCSFWTTEEWWHVDKIPLVRFEAFFTVVPVKIAVLWYRLGKMVMVVCFGGACCTPIQGMCSETWVLCFCRDHLNWMFM